MLLQQYHNSPALMVQALLPSHPWRSWQFADAPLNCLDDENVRKQALEWIGQQLKIANVEDWHNVTKMQILSVKKGGRLLEVYKGSIYHMLKHLLPQHQWLQWRFPTHDWFSQIENQREVLEWLSKELGITQLHQWYKVSYNAVSSRCSSLLIQYDGSLSRMLMTLHPDYPWLPWKFLNAPTGYWDNPQNRHFAVDWLAQQLHILYWEDWYRVTSLDIKAHLGALLTIYDGSPSKLVHEIYPFHPWLPWRFNTVPDGFWDNVDNQKLALEWLAKELSITHWEQWYNVTYSDIVSAGGARVLKTFMDSPSHMLLTLLPHLPWQPWKFAHSPRRLWENPLYLRLYFDNVRKEHNLGPDPLVLATKPAAFFEEFGFSSEEFRNALLLAYPGVLTNGTTKRGEKGGREGERREESQKTEREKTERERGESMKS